MIIYKEDGKKIIDFIEKTLKTKIPISGFLAGQSVCSALLYLKGKSNNFFINDLDIFHKKEYNTNKEHVRKLLIKNNKMIHTSTGLSSLFENNFTAQYSHSSLYQKVEDKEKIILLNKQEQNFHINREKRKIDILLGKSNKEEYANLISAGTLKYYADKTLRFTMQKPKKLFGTLRNGLFNHIYLEVNWLRKFTPFSILNDFDINCTQIGINLETKELFFTKEFLNFYNTMEMKIVSYDTPYHSIIRLFKKAEEFPDFNFSLEKESYIVHNHLKFGLFKKSLIQRENSKINKYCFGDTYLKKYNKSNINSYFDIVNLKEEKNDFFKNRDKSHYFDYNIYKLEGKCNESEIFKNDSHKRELEKKLGIKISSGYKNFLHFFLRDIIENKEMNKKYINIIKNESNIQKDPVEKIENKNFENKLKQSIFYQFSKDENIDINKIEEISKTNIDIKKYLTHFKNFNDFYNFYLFLKEFSEESIFNRNIISEHKFSKEYYPNPLNFIKTLKSSKTKTLHKFKKDYVKFNSEVKFKKNDLNIKLHNITDSYHLSFISYVFKHNFYSYSFALKKEKIKAFYAHINNNYYGFYILDENNNITEEYYTCGAKFKIKGNFDLDI